MQHQCKLVMEKCKQEGTLDTVPSDLKQQLLEAARDPLAAWLDEKVCTSVAMVAIRTRPIHVHAHYSLSPRLFTS